MLLSNGWQKFVVENAAVQLWAKICSAKNSGYKEVMKMFPYNKNLNNIGPVPIVHT